MQVFGREEMKKNDHSKDLDTAGRIILQEDISMDSPDSE